MQGHRGMYAEGGDVKKKWQPGDHGVPDFGGVQPWSAGDLFPGTVIGRGMPGGGHGYQGVYMHANDMSEWDKQPVRRTYDEARMDAVQWLKRLGIKRFDAGGSSGDGAPGNGMNPILSRMLGQPDQQQQQSQGASQMLTPQMLGWGRRGGWWMGGMAGGGRIPEAMRERALRLADGGAATYDTSAPMKRHRGQHRPSSWNLAEPGISASRDAQVGFGGGSHQYDGYTRGGNELTQGAIDSVRSSPLRSLLENAVGNSPSSISQIAQKRMLPGPGLAGLQSMLYSGDAMAPPLYDEPYEGHGKWQPFERLR